MACYRHAVSAIQVKNVPEDLHAQLRERAAAEGVTVGELILRAIRRELSSRTLEDWFAEVDALPLSRRPTQAEIDDAREAMRAERRWDHR
jgi:predicted nucleic acid-binding protein